MAGETAGGIAHDLANIIHSLDRNMIRMEKYFYKKTGLSSPPEELNAIKTQANNLYELNNQLLALSRRGRHIATQFDLRDLLKDLRVYFPAGEVTLPSSPPPLTLRGSHPQLRRALLNICINGLEAQGNKGSIELRYSLKNISSLKKCHHGFLPSGRYICIEITDTGSGIPDTIIDRIFEPFVSGKTNSLSGQSGTGLGLSVVSGIIEDHKGTIDVASGPQGTCFSLYLPTVETDVTQPDTVAVAFCATHSLEQYQNEFLKNNCTLLCHANFNEALLSAQHASASFFLIEHNEKVAQQLYALNNTLPNILIILNLAKGEDVSETQGIPYDATLSFPLTHEKISSVLKELHAT